MQVTLAGPTSLSSYHVLQLQMASCVRSPVWNHFTISVADESKAICNHCEAILSQGGKSPKTYGTSNLLKHLRTHHEAIFSDFQAADTNEASQVSGNNKSGRTQKTLDGFIQHVTPFAINHLMSRTSLDMLLK